MALRCTSRSSGQPRRFYRLTPSLQLRGTLRWTSDGTSEEVTLLDASEGGCSVVRGRGAPTLGASSFYAQLRVRLNAETELEPVTLKLRSSHGARLGFEFESPGEPSLRAFRERILSKKS